MATSYENQLNNWVNKEKSGVNLLNSVGTLMYDKGIELVLFRNKLSEIGVSELLNYISYAKKVVGRENNVETATLLAKEFPIFVKTGMFILNASLHVACAL